MRVALISYHTSPFAHLGSSAAGGMNLYVRQLAEGLGQRDVDVDVFTRQDTTAAAPIERIDERVRMFHVRAGPPAHVPKAELADYTVDFERELARILCTTGIHYDLIHSHYWLSGLAALGLRTANRPLVHMFHTLTRVKQLYQPGAGASDAPSREAGELRLLCEADGLVFATQDEVDDARQLYGRIPGQIALIPPGVDAQLFRPRPHDEARQRLGIAGSKLILFVGRMDRNKGVDYLLTAVSLLRTHMQEAADIRLVIVGGDDERRDSTAVRELTRLQTIAGDLGILDRVDFRGMVPHAELPFYYAAADVCAVPSLYESFGMVALEALACGRPVVGFRSSGLEQTVRNDETGVLVRGGNSAELAAALQRLLSDPAYAERLGRAARSAVSRFTWSRVVDRTLELYCRLVNCQSLALAGA